jgi:hypothetical protein
MPGPDRLALFLEVIDRLNLDDLGMTALAEPDPAVRAEILNRATQAAGNAGPDRLAELQATPGRIRRHMLVAYNRRGIEPSWFGLIWSRSIGRADDRAHLISAIEGAALAAVANDLLPADDLATLREPLALLASMRGTAPAVNPMVESRIGRAFVGIVGIAGSLAFGLGVVVVPLAVLIARIGQRRRPRE